MQESPSSYNIHWFRRDLRVAGNPALEWARQAHSGRVLGFFSIDSKIIERSDFSNPRFAFFLNTLLELQKEMQALGGDLLVMESAPLDALDKIIHALKDHHLPLPATFSFNRDYEPFARKRDREVETKIKNWGIQTHIERDHLVIEPEELSKPDPRSPYYQVYSPFAKRWMEIFHQSTIQNRIQFQKEGLKYLDQRLRGQINPSFFTLNWKTLFKGKSPFIDQLKNQIEKNKKYVHISIPEAGTLVAYQRILKFKNQLEDYQNTRDFPGIDGTSRMSIYIKNGSFVPSQIIATLGLKNIAFNQKSGSQVYLKELIWREFYYHILYHRLDVEKGAFLSKFANLRWENREDLFEAWKEGRTGYPIVDAGMRQLNQTGWMHNRVRMIVASFLCKDLLINWQWGENFFMKMLLDGDLAPNNGGWQWAASTGCDPQPYFRIFNPELQSKKFDPEGKYIKHFLPELRNLSSTEIHLPRNPIVNHQNQKIKALKLYSTV